MFLHSDGAIFTFQLKRYASLLLVYAIIIIILIKVRFSFTAVERLRGRTL